MNKRGFGLPEVLLFIGISLFFLLIVSIYLNRSFGKKIIYTAEDIEEEQEEYDRINNQTTIEVPTEYYRVEQKLKKAAQKYDFDKDENNDISLKDLKIANLIDNLDDPNSNEECNGYVLYTSVDKKYDVYINCSENYTTNGFNSDFIN